MDHTPSWIRQQDCEQPPGNLSSRKVTTSETAALQTRVLALL